MEQNTPVSATATLAKMEGPIEMLKFSWKLFRSNWKTIVPVAILPSALGYVGTLFMLSTHNAFFAIIGSLVSIVGAVFSIAAIPALINTIHQASTQPGSILPLKGQYRFGFGYFWSVLVLGIITGLVSLGATALFIVPGIIVGVYISLYSYALTIDGKKGFGALVESYDLIRGRWLPVVGRGLFLGLVALVVWIVIGIILSAFGLEKGSPKAVVGLINLVVNSVLTPIVVGYSYRIYTGLKSLRQAEIPLQKFKKWLVAFLSIGIIALVIAAITIPLVLFKSIKAATSADAARANADARIADIQRLMQASVPNQQNQQ